MKLDDSNLSASGNQVYEAIRRLQPKDDAQRTIQSQAMGIVSDIGKTRWQISNTDGETLPRPFLVVLASWLTGLFLSFGLFAPRNATVLVALIVCALSVAGAVFLVVDLAEPFEGVIQISSGPLRSALAHMGS